MKKHQREEIRKRSFSISHIESSWRNTKSILVKWFKTFLSASTQACWKEQKKWSIKLCLDISSGMWELFIRKESQTLAYFLFTLSTQWFLANKRNKLIHFDPPRSQRKPIKWQQLLICSNSLFSAIFWKMEVCIIITLPFSWQ